MSDIKLGATQSAVVNSDSGAIVVLAGAGSGKTEVIAHRIERLLTTAIDEDFRVLAVSYTAKAAEELRNRLRRRLGGLHKRVDSDTIHGFSLSIIRRFGTRIGLPPEPEILSRNEDRAELLQQWLAEQGRPPLGDASTILGELDMARTRCGNTSLLGDWKTALADRGALDYPEILDRSREVLELPWVQKNLRRTYKHVVVDEAQNLTPAQYEVLRAVIGPPTNNEVHAMLVGDERQSIVGFAGADPGLMGRFQSDYNAERFALHTNYRSAESIVAATARVAAAMAPGQAGHAGDVYFPAKGIIASSSMGDEREEGSFIAQWVSDLLEYGINRAALAPDEDPRVKPEDIAVLGRTAASLRSTQKALEGRGVSYAVGVREDEWLSSAAGSVTLELLSNLSAPGHKSVRRRLSLAVGSEDQHWSSPVDLLTSAKSDAFRALTPLARSTTVGEFMSELRNIDIADADWEGDVKLIQDAWDFFVDDTEAIGHTFGNFRQYIFRLQRGNDLDDGVRVLTVHKSQGREYRAVAIVGFSEGQFPDFRARSSEARLSELRALYVAMSRASRQLLVTWPRFRDTRYGPRATEPSSFLKYIPGSG